VRKASRRNGGAGTEEIQKLRGALNCSQTVLAYSLNVSTKLRLDARSRSGQPGSRS